MINVYLPPDYTADAANAYPVLYMPDGGVLEDFPHIANTIELFIVETFLLQPELFDIYIAISPSLWWNNENLVQEAAAILGTAQNPDLDLYLTSADESDIAPPVSRLVDEIRKVGHPGVRLKYEPRPDLRHNNIYRSVAPAVLQSYYSGR